MERQIKDWITINGIHIPIYEGEDKNDAFNRAVKEKVKADEDKKNRDIQKNQSEADERNQKKASDFGASGGIATSSVVKDAEKKLGFKLGKPINTYSSGATEYKPKDAYVTDKEEYDSYVKLMKNSILSHFVNYYRNESKEKNFSPANVDFSDDGFIVAYNSRGGKHYFKVKLPVDTVMIKASGRIVTHPKLNAYEYDAVGGELGEEDLDKLD